MLYFFLITWLLLGTWLNYRDGTHHLRQGRMWRATLMFILALVTFIGASLWFDKAVEAEPPVTLPDTTETTVPLGADEPWPDSGTFWPDQSVYVDTDIDCSAASAPELCVPAGAPLLAGCEVAPGEPTTWYTHVCPPNMYRSLIEYLDSLIPVMDVPPSTTIPPVMPSQSATVEVSEAPTWVVWGELALWVDGSGQAVGL